MKILSCTLFFLIFCKFSIAQNYEPTPEQIADNKRFNEIKQEFLSGNYELVLHYYDSILTQTQVTRIETYKMANISYHELSKENKKDSLAFIALADEVYNETIKWYGIKQVNECWDDLEIKISDEPELSMQLEQQPDFPGGMAEFYKYTFQEMSYPALARRMGIEGRVFIRFVINKDGSIDAVNTIKKLGGGCDEEAERVVKNAPNFIPGMQNGEPVYSTMILPFTFKLERRTPKNKKRRQQ